MSFHKASLREIPVAVHALTSAPSTDPHSPSPTVRTSCGSVANASRHELIPSTPVGADSPHVATSPSIPHDATIALISPEPPTPRPAGYGLGVCTEVRRTSRSSRLVEARASESTKVRVREDGSNNASSESPPSRRMIGADVSRASVPATTHPATPAPTTMIGRFATIANLLRRGRLG